VTILHGGILARTWLTMSYIASYNLPEKSNIE